MMTLLKLIVPESDVAVTMALVTKEAMATAKNICDPTVVCSSMFQWMASSSTMYLYCNKIDASSISIDD